MQVPAAHIFYFEGIDERQAHEIVGLDIMKD
jgi:hypothetical protein